jgi:hypothetical protein
VKLIDFKDIHKGKAVDILCNGPSRDLYKPTGNIQFCINQYWNYYDVTPTYAICQDTNVHKKGGYPPEGQYPAMWFVPDSGTYRHYEHRCVYPGRGGLYIDTSFKELPIGWRITFAALCQIAQGMGFMELNLYGVDLVGYPQEGKDGFIQTRYGRFFDTFVPQYPGVIRHYGAYEHPKLERVSVS